MAAPQFGVRPYFMVDGLSTDEREVDQVRNERRDQTKALRCKIKHEDREHLIDSFL